MDAATTPQDYTAPRQLSDTQPPPLPTPTLEETRKALKRLREENECMRRDNISAWAALVGCGHPAHNVTRALNELSDEAEQ